MLLPCGCMSVSSDRTLVSLSPTSASPISYILSLLFPFDSLPCCAPHTYLLAIIIYIYIYTTQLPDSHLLAHLRASCRQMPYINSPLSVTHFSVRTQPPYEASLCIGG